MNVLNKVNSPEDVKKLNKDELNTLASDIRAFLISSVSKTGGHLASNLGAVEITVAIHRVFDIPKDKLIFDVGHQCYVHKILTGRKDRMDTLRKFKGLSGFPKPYESETDCFIAGHASNSISVGLGFAQAEKLNNTDNSTVVLIGDGAMTGGLAYEGLINAGRSGANIIVCFNDNGMSISKTVGSSKAITKLRSSRSYFNAKSRTLKLLDRIPLIGKPLSRAIRRTKKFFKDLIYNTNAIEDIGYTYLGPVDGHDIKALENVLTRAKELKRPCFVHIITTKGKGFNAAENDPETFHGTPKFDENTGEFLNPAVKDFSAVFGETLCEMAKEDNSICAITAAMEAGCGLSSFAKEFPDRFFDVGIAEAHGMAFSSALAVNGMKPVFAVYSSFLQRTYDQLIHDVALMNSNMVIAVDRAGIVGADGETHNGMFDVNILKTVPNMTVLSPASFAELKSALNKAVYEISGPVAVRYPRGTEPEILKDKDYFGKGFVKFVNNNGKKLIVSYGIQSAICLEAAKETGADMLKINQLSPLPEGLKEALRGYDSILVVEEAEKKGGMGEEIAAMVSGEASVKIKAVSGFVEHGSYEQLTGLLGLDKRGIIKEL